MPPVKHQIKQVGDCMLVGGDCLTYIPYMSKRVDLILTDPPYGISYVTNHRAVSETPDMIHGDASLDLIERLLPLIARIMSDECSLYMFASSKNIEEVLTLVKRHYKYKNLLVWDKGNWTAGDLYGAYGSQYEFIVYVVVDDAKSLTKRGGDILTFPRVGQPSQIHPNQKPLGLLRFLIENTTKAGDTVFDPCMGSGSTGVACVQTGRRFVGCEIDPTYYHSAVASIEYACQRTFGTVPGDDSGFRPSRADTGNAL